MTINDLFQLGMDRYLPEPLPMPTPGIVLNIGAGHKKIPFTVPLDWPEYDAEKDRIPYPDGTISGIHCYHFLEHIKNVPLVLYQFQRVMKKGAVANIVVPYYNSQMMAQDLDHKSYFCEMTWKTLFSNPYYDKNLIQWKLKVHLTVIIGIVERNLALITQLVKG